MKEMTGQKFDMTGDDVLAQRFVDQELSAEERMRFVARLGRDEALRRRAIELEQLLLDVSKLPRPVVPDRFAAGVMERLEESPSVVPGWKKLADAFWAPRALQWNLASAVAVAAVAVIVTAGIVTRAGLKSGTADVVRGVGRTEAELKLGTTTATPVTAVAPATSLVRLVVIQPGARTVQVAGDFNGWNPARTSLEQVSGGAWAVTIPLKPGRYEYMFVVDGRKWIADPFAAEKSDDGFGSKNAVLEVRPGAAL